MAIYCKITTFTKQYQTGLISADYYFLSKIASVHRLRSNFTIYRDTTLVHFVEPTHTKYPPLAPHMKRLQAGCVGLSHRSLMHKAGWALSGTCTGVFSFVRQDMADARCTPSYPCCSMQYLFDAVVQIGSRLRSWSSCRDKQSSGPPQQFFTEVSCWRTRA